MFSFLKLIHLRNYHTNSDFLAPFTTAVLKLCSKSHVPPTLESHPVPRVKRVQAAEDGLPDPWSSRPNSSHEEMLANQEVSVFKIHRSNAVMNLRHLVNF